MTAPEPVLATVFTDYICPFCFIGYLRLRKVMAKYDMRINWCLVEIHPDNPPEGRPVEELGYAPEQWNQMMDALGKMAEAEGVFIKGDRLTVNSHNALLLAEAAKQEGRDIFYKLHNALFYQYFCEGKNIGLRDVLTTIAHECGVSDKTIERAWSDPALEENLQAYMAMAGQAQITGVPTYFIGEKKLVGAIDTQQLETAVQTLTEGTGA